MANAVDVARESVDCFNSGDLDRLRSLLADDSYEEESGPPSMPAASALD